MGKIETNDNPIKTIWRTILKLFTGAEINYDLIETITPMKSSPIYKLNDVLNDSTLTNVSKFERMFPFLWLILLKSYPIFNDRRIFTYENNEIEKSFLKSIFDKLKKQITKSKFITIYGKQNSGKSTLLKTILNKTNVIAKIDHNTRDVYVATNINQSHPDIYFIDCPAFNGLDTVAYLISSILMRLSSLIFVIVCANDTYMNDLINSAKKLLFLENAAILPLHNLYDEIYSKKCSHYNTNIDVGKIMDKIIDDENKLSDQKNIHRCTFSPSVEYFTEDMVVNLYRHVMTPLELAKFIYSHACVNRLFPFKEQQKLWIENNDELKYSMSNI